MPEYRSYSQLSSMDRCPQMYFLERIAKVWKRPAAWLPMGTAVHEAGEAWERSMRTMSLAEAQDVFRVAYWREVNSYLDETPNTTYWFASGPYRGPDDIQRRYTVGLEHVARYIGYYERHQNEVIWVDPTSGEMCIELGFDMDLDGVSVRGFIDAVVIDLDTMTVFPRDTKTGAKPGNELQLKTYGQAVEDKTGHEITSGDYFMTKKGEPTFPYDLTEITRDELSGLYHQADTQIRAGDFPAKPSEDKCRFCSVRDSCKYRA
jgi:putative RecB family exonuclease